ncbi:prolipoprotein diacylglyceryl transferase [Ureibacillus sinduriensis]|uniref:Phosphatidylglycerol--prolipoprotein diacylglyceryl transferase n=1 Tax=Ureibacillus sinduriensis BLB-1 = JCM 15800 TaxID=1384057 RepID=A0A0A3HTR8_9BACL|nr:prolipoprotein diacylglyceryl transferase [Ureibacillus sinduriensis]KGR75804.1 diacylglyceryl transferase [Ureibacillus sinduriensis BLB-1 = JCM 15800]
MEQVLLAINPVAFSLGNLEVRWYGILIALGIVLAYFVGQREAVKRGLPEDFLADLLIWAIPISIISARIYYVSMKWEYYGANPEKIIQIWNGGIAIHGALIGAVITAFIYCKKKGFSFLKVADILAPSLLIGQIIGRWGNFMNQEAYGGPVSREFLENLMIPNWIIEQMYVQDLGTYVHPTFLYESLWNVVGLIILLILRKVNLHRGEIFFSYMIWYSIGRFYIEGMRTDSLYLIEELLRSAQVVSILAIVLGIILIVYRRMKVRPVVRYLDEEKVAGNNAKNNANNKVKKK